MALPKQHYSIETLLLDRPYEPFGIGLEIRTPRREANRLNPVWCQKAADAKGGAVYQVPESPASTSSDGSVTRGFVLRGQSTVGTAEIDDPVALLHLGGDVPCGDRPATALGSRHALWWLLLLSSPIRPGGEAGAQQNDADGKKKRRPWCHGFTNSW